MGDKRGEARRLASLGRVHVDLGEPRQAIVYCEQALVIAHETESKQAEGGARWPLSQALFKLGSMPRRLNTPPPRLRSLTKPGTGGRRK